MTLILTQIKLAIPLRVRNRFSSLASQPLRHGWTHQVTLNAFNRAESLPKSLLLFSGLAPLDQHYLTQFINLGELSRMIHPLHHLLQPTSSQSSAKVSPLRPAPFPCLRLGLLLLILDFGLHILNGVWGLNLHSCSCFTIIFLLITLSGHSQPHRPHATP
jgi:hypothetical protein